MTQNRYSYYDSVETSHIAAENRCLQTHEVLFNDGADVHSERSFEKHYTPLLRLAVENCDAQFTKLLLKRGAHLNRTDNNHKTPLHIAAKKGHLQIVEYLLEFGADVNSAYRDSYGKRQTPLHVAVENRHFQVAEHLLNRGADVNATYTGPQRKVYTALRLAVKKSDEKITKLLLERGAYVYNTDDSGRALLHIAAEIGCLKVFDHLFNHGAGVSSAYGDSYGKYPPPLHIAIEEGHYEIVDYLLSHGVDVNSAYTGSHRKVYTTLHFAVKIGDEEMIKLLLNRGAHVNNTDDDGRTPLHIATEKGFLQIVEHLLNYGADVNSTYTGLHSKVYTPLRIAVEKGNEEMTKLILSRGVESHSTDKNGGTLLHIAAENGYVQVAENLLNYGADVNSMYLGLFDRVYTPLHLAVDKGDIVMTKLLLSKGANFYGTDENGRTLLHIATEKGYLQVVENLLDYGADVNTPYIGTYTKVFTPLRLAVKNRNEEMTILLLNRGAHAYDTYENGQTLLHIATNEGYFQIVKHFLNHGGDVNIAVQQNCTSLFMTFRKGYTPLHLAAASGHEHVVKLLLVYGANVEANGFNAQNLAEQRGHVGVVKVILGFKEEIEHMKREKIDNTKVFFHDILTASMNQLAMYAMNENILQVLKSDYHEKKFPMYASMIDCFFKKGIERKELLEQGSHIDSVSEIFHKLPKNCTEKIVGYLSNAHLRVLIDACKPSIS